MERDETAVDRHERAMKLGSDEYADVLSLLAENGYDAKFTQTGGMCAAIEFNLGDKHYVLVTDSDAPLSWDRAEHRGWAIGMYDVEDPSEPVWYHTTEDGSPNGLRGLLRYFAADNA